MPKPIDYMNIIGTGIGNIRQRNPGGEYDYENRVYSLNGVRYYGNSKRQVVRIQIDNMEDYSPYTRRLKEKVESVENGQPGNTMWTAYKNRNYRIKNANNPQTVALPKWMQNVNNNTNVKLFNNQTTTGTVPDTKGSIENTYTLFWEPETQQFTIDRVGDGNNETMESARKRQQERRNENNAAAPATIPASTTVPENTQEINYLNQAY